MPKPQPATLDQLRPAYENHFELVWRFVTHRGVAADAREGVVHAIFHLVRRQLIVKHHASPTRSWIARVARSVVRAHLRQRALATPFEAELVEDDLAALEALESQSATEQLHLILRSMSDLQREAFILCEMEELSLAEAAEALGIDEAMLSSCLLDAVRVFNSVSAELRARRFWMSRERESSP